MNEQWNYVVELLGSLKLRMALHYKTGHSLMKKKSKDQYNQIIKPHHQQTTIITEHSCILPTLQ